MTVFQINRKSMSGFTKNNSRSKPPKCSHRHRKKSLISAHKQKPKTSVIRGSLELRIAIFFLFFKGLWRGCFPLIRVYYLQICACVYAICEYAIIRYTQRPEDGVRFPGAGVTGSSVVNHAVWKLGTKSVPMQEQYTLFTAHPSLLPHSCLSLQGKCFCFQNILLYLQHTSLTWILSLPSLSWTLNHDGLWEK